MGVVIAVAVDGAVAVNGLEEVCEGAAAAKDEAMFGPVGVSVTTGDGFCWTSTVLTMSGPIVEVMSMSSGCKGLVVVACEDISASMADS